MSAADPHLPEGTDHIITGAGVGSEAEDVPEQAPDARIGEETMFTPDEQPAEGAAAAKDEGPKQPGEGGTTTNFFAAIDSWRTDGADKARDFAQAGIARATGALDEVVKLINDAADQIDEKVGDQYGGYARRAAEGIGGFGDMLKGKDVDQLFAEAREMVKKSPAIAIGTAAALGFAVARLARSGMDAGTPKKDDAA